jgi:ABC-type multidrug transport system ATPase subunit
LHWNYFLNLSNTEIHPEKNISKFWGIMLRIKNLRLLNGKSVTFHLNSGEVVFLEGENGAGKSLLMKSLAKLVPFEVDEFYFNSSSLADLRSKMLYLPPTLVCDPELTVNEFLDEPLALAIYKDLRTTFRPREHLEGIDLNTTVALLSSGQKQRLALLRSMSLKAQVLLLDEPFASIDQARRLEYTELLSKWIRAEKRAIIFVSHEEIKFPNVPTRTIKI